MALAILRKIAANIQKSKFSILVDETTDQSVKEQVVIVLRWVDEKLEVHEDFIGLYVTDSIIANSLVSLIHDMNEFEA